MFVSVTEHHDYYTVN